MRSDSTTGDFGELGQLQPFAAVARSLPPFRSGRPVHPSTISRWRSPGVKRRDGTWITLRAVRLPSGWVTTLEWVRTFIRDVTAERTGRPASVPEIPITTRRRREIERVDRELDALGI
jgi:hypothetical protein